MHTVMQGVEIRYEKVNKRCRIEVSSAVIRIRGKRIFKFKKRALVVDSETQVHDSFEPKHIET